MNKPLGTTLCLMFAAAATVAVRADLTAFAKATAVKKVSTTTAPPQAITPYVVPAFRPARPGSNLRWHRA